jgi:MFS family permease
MVAITGHRPITALLAASMFSTGITFASTLNYAAIVGIETLGIPNAFFSVLLIVSSLVSATASVVLGFISDRVPDRRIIVIGCALTGAVGFGLIYWLRSPVAFVVATGVIMPFGTALMSQTYAYSRSFYNVADPGRAEFMTSVLRTIFALAWAVVPPIVGWVAAVTSVFNVYGIAAVAYMMVAGCFALLLRNPAAKVGVARVHGQGGVAQPRAEVDRTVLVGMVGVTLILVSSQINIVSIPLLVTSTLGAGYAELGWFAGVAAAIELPFMLAWGYALRWVPKYAIIAIAALLYAIYLFCLSQVQSVEAILWLQLINGPATAALMSIPISYMQDAVRNRVGLSTSLLDALRVAAVIASAVLFGIVTGAVPDYRLLFVIAAGLAAGGAMLLVAAHRLLRVRVAA